jgi:hypothetical protein
MPTERAHVRASGRDTKPCLAWLVLSFVLPVLLGCNDDGKVTTLGPANARPSITSQPDTSCAVGDSLQLQVQAHDPDGDVLHYLVSFEIRWGDFISGHLPEGDINSQTGEFWFYPRSWDSPSRRVTFLVDDGRGGRDSTTFEVHVPWSQGGSIGC